MCHGCWRERRKRERGKDREGERARERERGKTGETERRDREREKKDRERERERRGEDETRDIFATDSAETKEKNAIFHRVSPPRPPVGSRRELGAKISNFCGKPWLSPFPRYQKCGAADQ